ncbi:glycosyltransferase family 39 protein [Sulfurospirillum sp.]|uniref:glycosyltransferase family 39 protein n=1 Tax=Sulfurospirillum sp. TaxID=2053622 RepID=UPI002FDE94D3
MKKAFFILIILSFLAEVLYFNIAYDVALLAIFICTALGLGSVFNIHVSKMDKGLIQLALGIGMLGCLVWLSTFYKINHKSVYLVASIFLIYLQKSKIFLIVSDCKRNLLDTYEKNSLILVILSIATVCYVIPASYPIMQYDALVKHIAIPFQIINHMYYPYNVLETIVYGDYALLPHMLYTYLLALNGTKAIVLLNLLISFLLLICLLRIASFISRHNLFIASIAILYLTTPLFYSLSTILYVDIYPLYFVFIAYLLIQYRSLFSLRKNLIALGFLAGLGMFAKQTAFYYLIPLMMYAVYQLLSQHKYFVKNDLWLIVKSCMVACLPFVPVMGVIWYKTGNPLFPFMNEVFKSPYFNQAHFLDPFYKNPLGFNFHSLYSIVFETTNNIEMLKGGVGFFILLLPCVVLIYFAKYAPRKRLIFFVFASLLSFWIATKFTYNIRYFMGSLILCIIPISYILTTHKYSKVFFFLIILPLGVVQIERIYTSKNYFGFKKEMLTPDNRLARIDNTSVLSMIPYAEKMRVLSNNDPYRGVFSGEFYSLDWYNTYLVDKVINKSLSPDEFLLNFHYYMIDKRFPIKFSELFDPNIDSIKVNLEVFYESDTHILYKVKQQLKPILHETLIDPIMVTATQPQVRVFEVKSDEYKINLDVAKADITQPAMARFQINWLDENGKFLGTSLIPFSLAEDRATYNSSLLKDIPLGAKTGVFYLTSHDQTPIKIYGFSLFGNAKNKALQIELDRFFQKSFRKIKE